MKEILTPLKLIGIKFFKTRDKEYYIKRLIVKSNATP